MGGGTRTSQQWHAWISTIIGCSWGWGFVVVSVIWENGPRIRSTWHQPPCKCPHIGVAIKLSFYGNVSGESFAENYSRYCVVSEGFTPARLVGCMSSSSSSWDFWYLYVQRGGEYQTVNKTWSHISWL